MTARTMPEWREVAPGFHILMLATIELASIVHGVLGWRATVRFTKSREKFREFDADLPSAKAWAESRALELLGVKG